MAPATPGKEAAASGREAMGARRTTARTGWTTAALLAPAYGWLALAVFLPLGAMLFFSILKAAPFGPRPLQYSFDNYLAFVRRPYLLDVAWTSIRIGLWTTGLCALIGLPAAIALARTTRGRARQVLFMLIVLPFWTNGLVRVFSWTMVLREGGVLDYALHLAAPWAPTLSLLYSFPAIIIGLVHAYLPYMILTCYLSVLSIEDAYRGRPQPRRANADDFLEKHSAAVASGLDFWRHPHLRSRHRQLHGAAHPRRAGRRDDGDGDRGPIRSGVQLAARRSLVVHDARG